MKNIHVAKKNKIVLVFDIDNNFDIVDKKYGDENNKISLAGNAKWVIQCAMDSIQNSYGDGAPRRVEMEKLYNNLRDQIKNQLTEKEIEELKLNR